MQNDYMSLRKSVQGQDVMYNRLVWGGRMAVSKNISSQASLRMFFHSK